MRYSAYFSINIFLFFFKLNTFVQINLRKCYWNVWSFCLSYNYLFPNFNAGALLEKISLFTNVSDMQQRNFHNYVLHCSHLSCLFCLGFFYIKNLQASMYIVKSLQFKVFMVGQAENNNE